MIKRTLKPTLIVAGTIAVVGRVQAKQPVQPKEVTLDVTLPADQVNNYEISPTGELSLKIDGMDFKCTVLNQAENGDLDLSCITKLSVLRPTEVEGCGSANGRTGP